MDDLISSISLAEIGKNEPASTADISRTRVALKLAKLPILPPEYEQVLMSFNGLSNDGPILLGVEENNNFFPNVVKYNKDFFRSSRADFLILGYDDFFYLIFDENDKRYKVVDRDNFEEITISAEIDTPLALLLHIDLP